MTIIFIRTLILYALVIFSVRLMGKRQLGELQPSELVITILISNIATLSLEDTDIPLLQGILPVLALVCFEVLSSWISLRFPAFRKLVSGTPQIIIRNGEIDQDKLRELRFSPDDLMASLRTAGIFSVEEVQFACAETNGTVSVLRKAGKQPAEKADVCAALQDADPPRTIIADGILREQALQEEGLDRAWAEDVLRRAGLHSDEVFLMTADASRQFTIIPKEVQA
ncbi:MAG: DUF421 domain-containing protein [Oscillospiraceae bacterium]|nr:DUF421 domain-containing protein [Oscillospiraceae bacterium]